MKDKAKSVIKEMFSSYMYYGYNFKFFIEQDYSIAKLFTKAKTISENISGGSMLSLYSYDTMVAYIQFNVIYKMKGWKI